MSDADYMARAIEVAKTGETAGEVPIGAVLVADGKIIAEAHNRKEEKKNPVRHAEIEVLEKGTEILGKYLYGATLYVTLEPCPMCAGAMLATRLSRLVFGAYDEKAGSAGSLYNLVEDARFNHRLDVTGGVMQEECKELLRAFFRAKRG